MIVAVTGHRPSKFEVYGLEWAEKITKTWLINNLAVLQPRKVITGMAVGVDTWMAETCVDLGIPFVAAVPFRGQEALWPAPVQENYHRLLEKAEQVVVVSSGGYSPAKLHARNRWMVDHAHRLLCVWDGSTGGTKACRDYALKVGCPIIEAPEEGFWDLMERGPIGSDGSSRT